MQHAVKTYGGMEVQLHTHINLVTRGSVSFATRPLYHGKKAPGCPLKKKLEGPHS